MSTSNNFPICTVCALRLDPRSWMRLSNGPFPQCWHQFLWKRIAVSFEGPFWPRWCPEPASLSIPDDAVSLRFAKVSWDPAQIATLPDGLQVIPQTSDEESSRGIVGIHFACLDLASRVIKTSRVAEIRSIGDLWVTLERRCAIVDDGDVYDPFLPAIPNCPNIRDDKPDDLENLDMTRSYLLIDNPYGSVGLSPYRQRPDGWLSAAALATG
ncbi:hypothetical protein BHE90_008048 [Fusarium euwallaceae]|uniref:Uncharacterized protein n=1 Tax=Fusarium euwallaceae TaxID=1147111 RepID=A0A430LP22_9HYPO|nr:hypothetical protein BHE90_008048 [Fusarium euwallaceae]